MFFKKLVICRPHLIMDESKDAIVVISLKDRDIKLPATFCLNVFIENLIFEEALNDYAKVVKVNPNAEKPEREALEQFLIKVFDKSLPVGFCLKIFNKVFFDWGMLKYFEVKFKSVEDVRDNLLYLLCILSGGGEKGKKYFTQLQALKLGIQNKNLKEGLSQVCH